MSNELLELLQKILDKAHVFSVVGWILIISIIICTLLFLYVFFIEGEKGYDDEIRREKNKLDKDELGKKQRRDIKRKIAELEAKDKRTVNLLIKMRILRLFYRCCWRYLFAY